MSLAATMGVPLGPQIADASYHLSTPSPAVTSSSGHEAHATPALLPRKGRQVLIPLSAFRVNWRRCV